MTKLSQKFQKCSKVTQKLSSCYFNQGKVEIPDRLGRLRKCKKQFRKYFQCPLLSCLFMWVALPQCASKLFVSVLLLSSQKHWKEGFLHFFFSDFTLQKGRQVSPRPHGEVVPVAGAFEPALVSSCTSCCFFNILLRAAKINFCFSSVVSSP